MSAMRVPETVWTSVYEHLFSKPGEHFAFMLADWTFSRGRPVLMVRDVVLVPDEQVEVDRSGWTLTLEGVVEVVNAASRSGSALIEVHNHGGVEPRFSRTDLAMLPEFSSYVFDSLPGRPYAATVWGDSTVYGEYFLPEGESGVISSITVIGDRLRQVVSRDDTSTVPAAFDRQLPWFTAEGQRGLGRLKVAVVGAGGTGSQVAQNLAFLGVRDLVMIDDDEAEDTNMNRLVTATAADLGTSKAILARRFVKSVAPEAEVTIINAKVQSREAIDVLKGVDVVFGCVDNDAPRLILNEFALAYGVPYFDLAVGIEAEAGEVKLAGGRVSVVLPGGPCLNCMGEIDPEEARFFLSSEEDRQLQRARGYVQGMEVAAPAVVSLNAAIAATATNEFVLFASGVRPVNPYTELDLLGTGRAVEGQWFVPRRVSKLDGCVQCATASSGDEAGIERYGSVTPAQSTQD